MGEYSVGTSRGQAHLVLRQDGTFRELLTSSGNVIDSAEGHWQNVSSNDDNAAVLIIAPHIVMGEDFNSSGSKESFFVFAKPKFGKIYGKADEVGPIFVKQTD